MKNEEKQALADLIVSCAKNDATQPPCWETDIVLRAVERLVIHELRQPLEFAEICYAAALRVQDPTALALIRLGSINGLRRDDSIPADMVSGLFTEVRREIDALPPSPRQKRCLGFWLYQGGVFYARHGYYAQAAQVHGEVVDTNTDSAEEAVSAFLAHLYMLWDALVRNQEVENRLKLLCDELPILQLETAGSKVDVLWGKANGPVHVLQAMVLSQRYDGWNHVFAQLQEGKPQLPQAFAPWVQILEAANILLDVRSGHFENVEAIEDALINLISGDAKPVIKAHAHLLLARLYTILFRYKRARLYYDEAQNEYQAIVPCPDCYMVASVAARELAELDRELGQH